MTGTTTAICLKRKCPGSDFDLVTTKRQRREIELPNEIWLEIAHYLPTGSFRGSLRNILNLSSVNKTLQDLISDSREVWDTLLTRHFEHFSRKRSIVDGTPKTQARQRHALEKRIWKGGVAQEGFSLGVFKPEKFHVKGELLYRFDIATHMMKIWNWKERREKSSYVIPRSNFNNASYEIHGKYLCIAYSSDDLCIHKLKTGEFLGFLKADWTRPKILSRKICTHQDFFIAHLSQGIIDVWKGNQKGPTISISNLPVQAMVAHGDALFVAQTGTCYGNAQILQYSLESATLQKTIGFEMREEADITSFSLKVYAQQLFALSSSDLFVFDLSDPLNTKRRYRLSSTQPGREFVRVGDLVIMSSGMQRASPSRFERSVARNGERVQGFELLDLNSQKKGAILSEFPPLEGKFQFFNGILFFIKNNKTDYELKMIKF